MKREYIVGEQIKIACEFRVGDVLTGILTDPTTIRFRFLPPVGGVVTYTYLLDPQVVRDAAGIYHVDLVLAAEGRWYLRFESDGDVVGADEYFVKVVPSPFV